MWKLYIAATLEKRIAWISEPVLRLKSRDVVFEIKNTCAIAKKSHLLFLAKSSVDRVRHRALDRREGSALGRARGDESFVGAVVEVREITVGAAHRLLLGRDVKGRLESVQQLHFGFQLAFRHFNFQIEMHIEAQVRRTFIPHLKPVLNTTKLKMNNC